MNLHDIEMPDGAIMSGVPEGTSMSEVEAQWLAAGGKHTKKVALGSGLMSIADAVPGIAASVGSGVLKAGAGLAGLPGSIINLVNAGVGKLVGEPPSAASHMMDAEDISNQADALMKKLFGGGDFMPYAGVHKPKNTVEKYVQAGAEGMYSMPGGLAMKLLGATSGLTGELADQAAGGNSPAARFAGALGPMIPGAYLGAKVPQMVKSLLQAAREAQPELAAAATRQATNKAALGTDVSITHGMDQTSVLPSIYRSIAGYEQGSGVRTQKAVEAAAIARKTPELAQSPTALPISTETQAAVSRAGSKALNLPKAEGRAITDPLYAEAKGDTTNISKITRALILAREGADLTGTQGGAVIDGYVKQLAKLAGQYPPGMTPIPNINRIARAAILRGESDVGDAGVKMAQQIAGDTIKKAAQEASPALARADEMFGINAEQLVNPAKAGPLGQSFPKQGRGASAPREWEAMGKIVNDLKADPVDLAELAGRLKQVSPEAFPLLLKRHFQEAGPAPLDFVKSTRGLSTDIGSQQMAASFHEKMKQSFLAQGKTAEEAQVAADGAARLMNAIEDVAVAHEAMPKSVMSQFAERGAESVPGEVAKLLTPYGFVRTWFGVNKLEKILQDKVLGNVSELFTSPNAAERLAELAQFKPGAHAAEVLLKGAAGLFAQTSNSADTL